MPYAHHPEDRAVSLAWTGRNPVCAGWLEMRPVNVPRDARPLYDEDLDCVIGYRRTFAEVSFTYDLRGDMRRSPDCGGASTSWVACRSIFRRWRWGTCRIRSALSRCTSCGSQSARALARHLRFGPLPLCRADEPAKPAQGNRDHGTRRRWHHRALSPLAVHRNGRGRQLRRSAPDAAQRQADASATTVAKRSLSAASVLRCSSAARSGPPPSGSGRSRVAQAAATTVVR